MRRGICPKQGSTTKPEKKTLMKQISNLPDKEIKVMVIKMLTELGRRMDEHSENFIKKIEFIIKYQTGVKELKNTIPKLKNILNGFKAD